MFAKAYELASKFTLPVISSLRFHDGTVTCGLGSFIVVNDKGWILTVAHLFDSILKGDQDILELKKFNEDKEKINTNPTLLDVQKKKQIKALEKEIINPKWITNHSLWWGSDNYAIDKFEISKELDLAVGQIKNFDSKTIEGYPVFKDPKSLKNGTSLCKLGFPFHNIESTYDSAKDIFQLAPNVLPVPRFPLEGIFTRGVDSGKTKDGRYDIKLIETSSPGLRGQSGGPTFDINGNIWAIQSRTIHLPLGFEPKVIKQGKEVTEIQFLNVGWGVHVESILQFLDSFKIEYSKTED